MRMWQERLRALCAAITLSIGALSCYGWLGGVPYLTRWLPYGQPMVFAASLLIIALGAGLLCLKADDSCSVWRKQASLSFSIFCFLLVCYILFAAALRPGVSIANYSSQADKIDTGVPGLPSFFTLICAMVGSFALIRSALQGCGATRATVGGAAFIMLIASSAIAGYAYHIPKLYFQFANLQTGMAFITALAFLSFAAGLALLPGEKERKEQG